MSKLTQQQLNTLAEKGCTIQPGTDARYLADPACDIAWNTHNHTTYPDWIFDEEFNLLNWNHVITGQNCTIKAINLDTVSLHNNACLMAKTAQNVSIGCGAQVINIPTLKQTILEAEARIQTASVHSCLTIERTVLGKGAVIYLSQYQHYLSTVMFSGTFGDHCKCYLYTAGQKIFVGENSIVGTSSDYVKMKHGSIIKENVEFYGSVLGESAVIFPNVKVGKGTVINAHACIGQHAKEPFAIGENAEIFGTVSTDIPSYAVVMGLPKGKLTEEYRRRVLDIYRPAFKVSFKENSPPEAAFETFHLNTYGLKVSEQELADYNLNFQPTK